MTEKKILILTPLIPTEERGSLTYRLVDDQSYEVDDTRFLGVGKLAEVRRIEKQGRPYALKLLHRQEDLGSLYEEFEVLQKLEAAYGKPSPDPLPIPIGCQLVRAEDKLTTPRMGILMPLLGNSVGVPLLADQLRDIQMTTNTSDAFEAERILWLAAKSYLGLLQKQIQIGKITLDRKRDTFWWDWRNHHLIVTDWNAMQPTTGTSETEALKNFAQNWFMLFTAKQPHLLSELSLTRPADLLDSPFWGDMSLHGRLFLLSIARPTESLRVASLSKALSSTTQFVEYMDAGKKSTVEGLLKQAREFWQDIGELRIPVSREFLFELAHADLAVRWGIEGAQDLYDEMAKAWRALNRPAKLRNIEQWLEAPKSNTVWERLETAIRDALKEEERHLRRRYEYLFFDQLDVFTDLPISPQTRQDLWRTLKDKLETAEPRLRDYNIELKALVPELWKWLELIQTVVEFETAWMSGDKTTANARYEVLKKYSPERLEALGLSHERLTAMQANETESAPAFSFDDVRRQLVAAVRDGTFDEVMTTYQAWMNAAQRREERWLLGEFLDDARVLLFANTAQFTPSEAGYRLARRLAEAVRRTPDLTEHMYQLGFVQSLAKHYAEKRKSMSTCNQDIMDKKLGDSLPALYEARLLNRLLFDLITRTAAKEGQPNE
jgi:hypothetical protein